MSSLSGARQGGLHPSISKLLTDHPDETDPVEIIRKLARYRVAYAKRFGWSGPSFCPILLSSLANVECVEVDHDIGGDGRIILDRQGEPIIEYRSGYPKERQRFTIFHEFAHLLFPDYCKFVPHHHNASEIESEEHRQFENLCDVAAGEMMMPVENFQADISGASRIDADFVCRISERYLASIDATIARLADLGSSAPFLAAFMTDQQGKHSGTGPLWVRYIKKSNRFRGFIWPGSCPPPNSIALDCLRQKRNIASKRETWMVKGQPRTFNVEAIKLPEVLSQPNYPKVVVLFS